MENEVKKLAIVRHLTIFVICTSFLAVILALKPSHACEEVPHPGVQVGKLVDNKHDHCIDMFITYHRNIGPTNSTTITLTGNFSDGNGFATDLEIIKSFGGPNPDQASSYFCLSENALNKSTILIKYWQYKVGEKVGECSKKITIKNLEKLLAETQEALEYKKNKSVIRRLLEK